MSSTACFTSSLEASPSTRNTYWLLLSVSVAAFSETCGCSSTFIKRSLFMGASETLFEHAQRTDGGDHGLVLDQAHRIERADRHDLDMRQVAGRQEQLFLERL